MTLYLTNATYIHPETLAVSHGHFQVTEGELGTIVPVKSIPRNNTSLDCTGKFVTKSFVCGHHHAYSAMARGMGAPKQTPHNFHEILQYIWWNLDKCLTDEMVYISALVTAIQCAKNGVTFCIDHHASPMAVPGSLRRIAQAFEQVGISHLLCYEISDRDGQVITDQGLAETESWLQTADGQALVGLHASFTISDKTLAQAVKLAANYQSGIHIHVAEDPFDQTDSQARYGKSVIARLDQAGVLDYSKTILGHCLHLSQAERDLLCNRPSWIAYCPESNQNNRVGTFNGQGLGNNIMLGTDGMHSDMLRSAHTAYFTGQLSEQLSGNAWYQRLRNAHRYLQHNQFNGDGANNLVILDYDSPTPVNSDNMLGHWIYGLGSHHIQHVIAKGKLIVKDRHLLTVDEIEILKKSQLLATQLWDKMND